MVQGFRVSILRFDYSCRVSGMSFCKSFGDGLGLGCVVTGSFFQEWIPTEKPGAF